MARIAITIANFTEHLLCARQNEALYLDYLDANITMCLRGTCLNESSPKQNRKQIPRIWVRGVYGRRFQEADVGEG